VVAIRVEAVVREVQSDVDEARRHACLL
jgi:hypothetical protein